MGDMAYGGGAESEENLLWNLFHRSWSWLQMVASLACLSWPLRLWPMHIGRAHWHRVGHIHHKSFGRNPQNELQSPLEGFDINPQPLVQVISQAALQIISAFFCLPLVSQTFSYLAELPWLPLNRLTRRLECVWRRRRSSKQMKVQWAISGFCQSAPNSLPCVHKIPLSTNLRSSIKRLENFKYQTFCLEVKFQSFDCIWGVCIEKKYHGKGQTICRVSLEDEQKAEGTQPTLQKRRH